MRTLTPTEVRFEAKVKRLGPDDCWPWTAGLHSGKWKYGVFHPTKGKTVGAHRFALEQSLGRELGPGMAALHRCDNPPCCNPRHLFEGTQADNVRDAVEKARHKRGADDPNAKLSDETVVAIREQVASGVPQQDVASAYGVSIALLSGIVRGKRWKHVGGPLTFTYRKVK